MERGGAAIDVLALLAVVLQPAEKFDQLPLRASMRAWTSRRLSVNRLKFSVVCAVCSLICLAALHGHVLAFGTQASQRSGSPPAPATAATQEVSLLGQQRGPPRDDAPGFLATGRRRPQTRA